MNRAGKGIHREEEDNFIKPAFEYVIKNIEQGKGDFRSKILYATVDRIGEGTVCSATVDFILRMYYGRRDKIENYEEVLGMFLDFYDKLIHIPKGEESDVKQPLPNYYILKNLLDDTDEFLRHLEDFTHGKDGDTITELRYRIRNYQNRIRNSEK